MPFFNKNTEVTQITPKHKQLLKTPIRTWDPHDAALSCDLQCLRFFCEIIVTIKEKFLQVLSIQHAETICSSAYSPTSAL